jgi:2-enoate reductase
VCSLFKIWREEKMFPKLFEQICINKVAIKNRIAMASMNNRSQFSFAQGALDERGVEYYKERIRGGVGLILTGVFKVENEIETEPWPILTEYGATRLAELADYAHALGSRIFIQLSAGAGRNYMRGKNPVSASPVPAFFFPDVTCRELTISEVERIVMAFGRSAALVAAAGIDGIEVHGHEGYLLDCFTSSMMNKRTDKYGGDLNGRFRFSLEILKAIRDVVGSNYPVIYRFAMKHFIKDFGQGILDPEEKDSSRDIPEGLEVAKLLEKSGYDALDIDAGCYESLYWAHPPGYQPHGCYVNLMKDVKKHVKIPVIVAGRLGIPELAQQVIADGKADMIALGRDLLADPYWPVKAQAGQEEQIRPCIGCHKACMDRARNRTISCSVNPSCGREIYRELTPAEHRKKVVIVGGGVAGMEAARVAALRGHEVSLYEKSDRLGGHLVAACVPDFKQDIKRLLDWHQGQMQKLNITVYMQKDVDLALLRELRPDVAVIATGSVARMQSIPGADRSGVVTCSDLLLGKAKPGKEIVIIGGGLIGSETALWLAKEGARVTILEMLPAIAQDFHMSNRSMLLDLLAKYNVKILTNTMVQAVSKNSVEAIDKLFKTYSFPCDQVALATGQKPSGDLYRLAKGQLAEVYEIGDSTEPRNIHFAIWDGYVVGSSI